MNDRTSVILLAASKACAAAAAADLAIPLAPTMAMSWEYVTPGTTVNARRTFGVGFSWRGRRAGSRPRQREGTAAQGLRLAGSRSLARCARRRRLGPAGQRREQSTSTLKTSIALLLALAAGLPASAQGRLDAATLKAFGGTYQLDCASNTSPKATVFADALVFLDGDRRVAGARLESAASFNGPNQPPEFRTVLLSDAPGGQLRAAVYQDKAGHYLLLDPDPKVQAAMGKSFGFQKFRRCDGGATAAPTSPSKTPPLEEMGASGFLLDAKARATYQKAIGPLARERWLARLDGPSPQNKRIKVAGVDFVLISACKNHDCADHNAVFLYSATQNLLNGLVYQRGRTTLVGQPAPAVAAELPRLWKKEWRSS